MQICKLTITSSVDGRENKIVRMGKLEILPEQTRLYYREEGAEVTLCVRKGEAEVLRKGDYSMRLPLKEGEKTLGELELAGASGALPAHTRTVDYTQAADSLEIFLHYHLLFGEDAQEMKLRIQAVMKGGKR